MHEPAERSWGQRMATNFHLLSAVEGLAEFLGDIVLSTAVAALLGVVGSRLVEVCHSLGYRSEGVVASWLVVQTIRSMAQLAAVQ